MTVGLRSLHNSNQAVVGTDQHSSGSANRAMAGMEILSGSHRNLGVRRTENVTAGRSRILARTGLLEDTSQYAGVRVKALTEGTCKEHV